MACATVKRHFPQEDGDSVALAFKRLRCSTMEPCSSPSRSPPPRIPTPSSSSSQFPEISKDVLTQRIEAELRRICHRRNPSAAASTTGADRGGTSRENEQPVYSVSQIRHVCSRLLREREAEVRTEYDKVLAEKLAEQYETFVKFAQDQIAHHTTTNQSDFSWLFFSESFGVDTDLIPCSVVTELVVYVDNDYS